MQGEWEHAVNRGEIEALERLLDSGADINAKDQHGQTALMIAARNGQGRVVQFLVGQGADLDQTAKYHLSALMLAVIGGHLDIVRMLMQADADTGVRGTGAPGFNGKTALDLAVAQGRDDIADALRCKD